MSIPHDRWRISLEGHNFDALSIAEEFDRELVWHDCGGKRLPFLSMAKIVKAATQSEVREQARNYLEELNSTLAIAISGYAPVGLGPYVEQLASDGTSLGIGATVEVEPAIIRIRGGNVTLSIGGSPVPRAQSLAQRIVILRDQDANFDAACAIFGVAGIDYRVLYVVLEYIRNATHPNGDNKSRWAALKGKKWIDWDRVDHFRETAQTYRHALPKLQHELEVREAQEILRTLITAMVEDRVPR